MIFGSNSEFHGPIQPRSSAPFSHPSSAILQTNPRGFQFFFGPFEPFMGARHAREELRMVDTIVEPHDYQSKTP